MFKIALLEIKNNKNYKKILISITVSLFIIFLIVSINLIVRNLKVNTINNEYGMLSATSLNYFESRNYDFDYDFISDVREYKFYSGNSSNISVTIDKKTNDCSRVSCIGVDINDDILAYNDLIQYRSLTNKSLIKYGNEIKNENEVLITEGLLKELGFNPKEVIGKEISICDAKFGVFGGFVWLEGLTICGVLDENVYRASPTGTEFIMVSNTYYNKNASVRYLTRVYFKNYEDMDYRMSLINSKYDIEFDADYSTIEFFIEKVEGYSNYILLAVTIFSIVIIIGLIVYILSMFIMNFEKSKITNMILYSYGLKNKSILDLIILNIIYLIGYLISTILIFVIILIIKNIILEITDVNIINYKPIVISNLIVFIVFGIVISLINLFYHKFKNNK